MTDNEGILVAGGNHVVPNGVAVEELNGGGKKLSKDCPSDLRALLELKGLVPTYEKMVTSIVKERNTRNVFGKWKDDEFVSIVDLFRDDFAVKGVKVALCKRKSSGSGTQRWLEFIDVDALGATYVPQYDVANISGQVIKTYYTTMEFPRGVAVEELKQWGKARKRLQEKIPIFVEKMLEEKNLMEEYHDLVEDCVNAGVGGRFASWDIDKLKGIMQKHQLMFEAKGVSIFVSHKQEYISHGGGGGHVENYRWIEFVDREQQPNYFPQRDAASKKESCVVN